MIETNKQLFFFIKQFNIIASTIDIAAPFTTFLENMKIITKFVKMHNINFFKKYGVKIDLAVLEVIFF